MKLLRQLSKLLGAKARRKALVVFVLALIMAMIEAMGVASVMPFIAVLSNPSIVDSNIYLQEIYERIGFQSTNQFLVFLGAGTFVLLMLAIVMRAVTLWAHLSFMNYQVHEVSSRLVHHYLSQPYEWFLQRSSSDIGVKVLSEVTNVIQGVVFQLMSMGSNAIVALMLFAVLIVVDPVLAVLATIILGGAYLGVYLMVVRYLSKVGRARVVANRRRYKVVQEAFGGFKEIKVRGLEYEFSDRFDSPSREMARLSVSGAVVGEFPTFAMQAVVFGGMVLVMVYLIWSHGTFQDALPFVALYALAAYRLMPALQGVYRSLSQLRFNLPALDALHVDIDEAEWQSTQARPSPSGSHSQKQFVLETELKFTDVEYSYPCSERMALQGISLTVPAFTTVALVGATGSGKSTIADLMLGLLLPSAGSISVDGTQITSENVREWLKGVGYVSQSIFLADDTVIGNIAFGVPPEEVDEAAVVAAARIANVHRFVNEELADGYRTLVGERGVRLSGGQRQRIAIARALYNDPQFVVFDEATSALDNVTEVEVMDAVKQLGGKKTIVLIAHRLSTVRLSDQIFFFDDGRIVAYGKYDELIESCGKFRDLVDAGVMG